MLTEAEAVALLPEVLRALPPDRFFVRIDLKRTDMAGVPLTCRPVIRDTASSNVVGLTRVVGFDGEYR
jgi:hypothetical protein